MATKSATKIRPVHEVRLGRIRAAIWENETQNGTRHNVTVSRLYNADFRRAKPTDIFLIVSPVLTGLAG